MTRESLADREVVYRKLIEAAPDAIVIANQEGGIVLVNAQAEKHHVQSLSATIGGGGCQAGKDAAGKHSSKRNGNHPFG